NIPAKKVYLANVYKWKIFLDSATYKDGKFTFKYKPKILPFEPFVATIEFVSERGIIQGLMYKTHTFTASAKENGNNAFVLQPGTTIISGDAYPISHNATNKLQIKAGKETEVFYKTQFLDFGYLSETDSIKRKVKLNTFKQLIEKYPSSYYLLDKVNNYKLMYSNTELAYILSSFDQKILESKLAGQIKDMIAARSEPPLPFSKFILTNSRGVRNKIIDTTVKLNMIVLWASWCGPCRLEIPDVKYFQNKFEKKGLHISGISVDDNILEWKNALRQEQMKWEQFIVNNYELETIRNRFSISAIPIIVLINNKGEEIIRFNGFDESKKKDIQDTIEKYIK
ncbi:MAG: TlpA disulfide reductase family protein, partial [Ferruginibacter sp.]